MKILFIRFSSIGDIVLTTPIVRCTRKKFPNAEIHYFTKQSFSSILTANPNIDKVFGLEGDIQPVLLELIKEKYDVIIDLHKNIRTRYVKSILTQVFNSNIKKYSFNKINIRKWLMVQFKWNLLPDKSIVERYFEGVKKLGVVNDGQGLDYFIPEDNQLKKDDLPMSHMLGFIACAIGGQHATKKMPLEKWLELCNTIQHPIILLGGQQDYEMAETIKATDPVKIYNACGKFSLHESAHIIQKSRLVITHDTGLMHIAAAFKKEIISIWGNTIPEFGMFPYYGFNNLKQNVAPMLSIVKHKVSCQPCSKIGYQACPKKHFNCMNKIDIAQVGQQVAAILIKK